MCQNMQLSMQEKKANMDADVGVLRAELAKEKQLRVRATCSVAPQHTQGQCVLMYAHTHAGMWWRVHMQRRKPRAVTAQCRRKSTSGSMDWNADWCSPRKSYSAPNASLMMPRRADD